MDFDWQAVVRTVAPALATALGGPLAGVAVSAISSALLGKPSGTEAEIAEAIQVGGTDALLALRKANIEFEYKMRELDLKLAEAQTQVNLVEATSDKILQYGWRPYAGWVCGFGLTYDFLLHPLLNWVLLLNEKPLLPGLEIEALMTLLFGMLGLGGYRTFEKTKGVAR